MPAPTTTEADWTEIDPFRDRSRWIDEGLVLGRHRAVADGEKWRDVLGRPYLRTMTATGNALSRLRRGASARIDSTDGQMPWLPAWPRLASQPFHPPEVVPWTRMLENAYPAIRRELKQCIEGRGAEKFRRGIYDGFGGKPWKTLYFFVNGERVGDTHEACPATSAILDKIPHNGMHVCFSAVAPDGALPPHVGPTNANLILHMGLQGCEGSMIFAGRETRKFEEGKCLILDDSFVHGVRHVGPETRYTLMITFWHYDASALERRALDQLFRVYGHLVDRATG
jgi:aspartate beta-hydroxylase